MAKTTAAGKTPPKGPKGKWTTSAEFGELGKDAKVQTFVMNIEITQTQNLRLKELSLNAAMKPTLNPLVSILGEAKLIYEWLAGE